MSRLGDLRPTRTHRGFLLRVLLKRLTVVRFAFGSMAHVSNVFYGADISLAPNSTKCITYGSKLLRGVGAATGASAVSQEGRPSPACSSRACWKPAPCTCRGHLLAPAPRRLPCRLPRGPPFTTVAALGLEGTYSPSSNSVLHSQSCLDTSKPFAVANKFPHTSVPGHN